MYKSTHIIKAMKIIKIIEDSFVVVCLSGILFIAILQIILRNLFSSGLIWGDSMLSVLVLWLGLAGSIVASRQDKHINIDVFSQHIADKYKIYIKKSTSLFTAFVCLIISYYSFKFVKMEFYLGEEAFANIPVWITEAIIPFAFFVMGIRYILRAIFDEPVKYSSPVKSKSVKKTL